MTLPLTRSILATVEESVKADARAEVHRESADRLTRAARNRKAAAEREEEARDGARRRLRDIVGASLSIGHTVEREETAEGFFLRAMFASATVRRDRGTNGVSYSILLAVLLDERQTFPDMNVRYRNAMAAETAARKALEPYGPEGRLLALGITERGSPAMRDDIFSLLTVVPEIRWGDGGLLIPSWRVEIGRVTLATYRFVSDQHREAMGPVALCRSVAEATALASEPEATDPVRDAFRKEMLMPRPTPVLRNTMAGAD